MLGAIVREAHEHCGVEMRTSAVRRMRGNAHPSGRLDCMLSTAEMRTAYWHLGEETLITAVAEEVEAPEEERLDEAAKYGLDEGQHRIAPGHRCR